MIVKEIVVGKKYLLSNSFDFAQISIKILSFEKTSETPSRLDLDDNYYECFKIFYEDIEDGLKSWDIVIKSELGFEYESWAENKEGYISLEEI